MTRGTWRSSIAEEVRNSTRPARALGVRSLAYLVAPAGGRDEREPAHRPVDRFEARHDARRTRLAREGDVHRERLLVVRDPRGCEGRAKVLGQGCEPG